MKLRNATWFLLAATLLASPQKDTGAEKQLEAAIHTEMVKGDLKGAVEQYRKIVAQNGKQRAVAARALFQMGQCQEKLGQAEARKAYERLVKEYSDQTEFAGQARAKLAAMGGQAPPRLPKEARMDPNCGIPSANGRVAVCVKKGQLFVRDLSSGQERRLLEQLYTSGWDSYTDIERGHKKLSKDWTKQMLRAWALSPDAAKLAYVVDGSERAPQIRIINTDGSGDRPLLDETGLENVWLLSWSPDSRQVLAGASRKLQKDYKMVLLSVEGGAARFLGPDLPDSSGDAHFSPDGKYIAYRGFPQGKPPAAIYTMAVKGGDARRLFENPWAEFPRGWMSDGRLVFVRNRTGGADLWSVRMLDGKPAGEPEVVIKNLESGMFRGRMDQNGSYYYWTFSDELHEVYKSDLNLSSGQAITEPSPISRRYVGVSNWPAYSRDGQFLAYGSGPVRSKKIYVRNLSDGGERIFDPALANIDRLGWYPDGSALLILARKSGGVGFFHRLDLKTAQLTEILSGLHPDAATNPSFSPDGLYVYFKGIKPDENCVARLHLQTGKREDVFCPGKDNYLRLFALSPDGTRLVFGGRKPDKSDSIQVVPVSGGEPKVLYEYPKVSFMRGFSGLAWTADGNGVLHHRPVGRDADELWLLSVKDGSSKKLLSTGCIFSITVHPNGHEFAWDAEIGPSTREMWVIDNLLPPLRAAGISR